MKNDIKLILISGIVGFFLGLFSHIIYLYIDNYNNRPILNFNIRSFTVNQLKNKSCELRFKLYSENIGKSTAIYKFEKCNIYFPLIDTNTLIVKKQLTFTLNPREHKLDTILIDIPSSYNASNFDKFSSFSNLALEFNDIINKKTIFITKDTTDVETQGKLLKENEERKNLKEFYTIDYRTGDSILIRGIHEIFYNNKFYKNHFYPSDAIIKYEIKDDKILLKFTTNANKSFLYYPNSEIADKIIFPNRSSISGTIEQNKENGKEFKNFKIVHNDCEGDLYFFLFK